MFKKVLYNTGSQIVGKVISASTTLLVTVLIGRSLGPAGFGQFTKIFVFVGYFYTFVDFGLNTIFVKFAKEENLPGLLKSLIGLRIILAFSFAILAILISFILPFNPQTGIGFSPLVKVGIIIASATIVTQALLTTANAYFQKILRYDFSTVAVFFGSIVILTASAFVTFSHGSVLGYVVAYILGGITFAASSYFLIFKKLGKIILPVFSKHKSLELLSHSWPVGVALIFNLLYFRIDVLILANWRSSEEVGLYGLAYQFFEASLSIPIFFANALYPILNGIYQVNLAEFKKQVVSWLKILTAVSLLLVIALIAISYFIPFIYDKRFGGSVLALQILAIGIPFFFISALFWHLLIIYGKQKLLIYIYGVGAVINLIANLIFIPIYGYLAAATITVVSEALITFLLFMAIHYTKNYQSEPT